MKKAIIILAAALLAGCADVPEGLKGSSRTETDGKPTEIEYIPVGEVQDDVNEALSRSYAQFILSDGLQVQLPEEYNEVDLVQADGYESRFDEAAAMVLDEDDLSGTETDSTDYIENSGHEPLYTSPSRLIRDEARQIHINLHGSGFFCFMRSEAFLDPDPGRTVELFFPQQGDDLSKAYELDGESVTVAEAVRYAEQWISDSYALLEPDYQHRVSCVIVCQNEKGEYCYRILFEKLYKGVELNNSVNPDYVKTAGEEHIVNISQTIDLQMRRRGEICFLTNGNGILLPNGEHRLEKIASLSSVLGRCEKQFADLNSPLTVTEISLAYSLTPRYDHENFQSPFHPGIGFDSRLVWQIVMDVPDEERFFAESSIYDTAGRLARYIQIDAETGDMEFEFDINELM